MAFVGNGKSPEICARNMGSGTVSKYSMHVTCDQSAIQYVLPVLWIASCLHIMGPVGKNPAPCDVSSSLPDGSTGGAVAATMISLFVCETGEQWYRCLK